MSKRPDLRNGARYLWAVVWLASVACKGSPPVFHWDAGPSTCPATCDDQNPCTEDQCDPVSHRCISTSLSDGTPCEDGIACTVNDLCQGGLCLGGPFKTCQALDQCHVVGRCDPQTGECTHPIASAVNSKCDDGDVCTIGDQCVQGKCAGKPRCFGEAICDLGTLQCMYPNPIPGGPRIPGFPTPLSASKFANVEWADAHVASDSLFVTGTLAGPVDMGLGTLEVGVANNKQILLANIDPASMKTRWAKAIGDPEDIQERGVVAVGANGLGRIAIVGELKTTRVLDQLVAPSAVGDSFILTADGKNGTTLWFRGDSSKHDVPNEGLWEEDRITWGTRGVFNSIAGDPGDDAFVFCATIFQKAVSGKLVPSKNPYPTTHRGGTDVVVGRLDGRTGATLWIRQIGGTNNDACSKVVVDPAGTIYVAGTYTYNSDLAFDGLPTPPLVTKPDSDVKGLFLLRLDRDGKAGWLKGFWEPKDPSSQSHIVPSQLLALPDGVAVTGEFKNTNGLSNRLFSNPTAGLYIAKLAGDSGAIQWFADWYSPLFRLKAPTGLAATSKSDLLVAGSYEGALVLGDFNLVESTNPSIYIARVGAAISPDGRGVFSAAMGYGKSAVEKNTLQKVLVNNQATGVEKDTISILGTFQTTIDFGDPLPPLTTKPTFDSAFLVKIMP